MSIPEIVAAIDEEISRLSSARKILSESLLTEPDVSEIEKHITLHEVDLRTVPQYRGWRSQRRRYVR